MDGPTLRVSVVRGLSISLESAIITYARSRLWLGISGVGAIVVISSFLLFSGLPVTWLPSTQFWTGDDLAGLLAMIGGLVAVMAPLDFLGGYLLPNRSRPGTIPLGVFAINWVRGVLVQATIFLLASLAILAMGRSFGLIGACLAILLIGVAHVAFQLPIARLIASLPRRLNGRFESGVDDGSDAEAALSAAWEQISRWGWQRHRIVVLDHGDTGFTGGVVGLPGLETIVVPAACVSKLTPQQLAVTIARRLEAIQSGSRTRGMLLAFAWVITGFVLSASIPGAGVTSVGELAMTCLGFTLWTFLGLLTLPTLSRQASYAIDRRVMNRGASPDTLHQAVQTLDRLQDDEPTRSKLIETIFHPVPSVDNRRVDRGDSVPIAWHAARMTLFVSWACMGMLVRAVHCNVGRPELWVMLPTD